MKALVWHGTNDVRVERVPDPKILNPRDAIVKITTTAICGSDLHLLDGYIPTMQAGDILGHEFMGEVVEVGKENKKLKVGDRVVVPFTIACGGCFFCEQAALVALRQLESERLDGREDVRLRHVGALRLLAHDGRLRRRPGGVRARAVRRRRAAQDSRTGCRDEQVLFLSDIFPTGYMAAENCDIQPRRHGRRVGLRAGRAVRDPERVSARRRARHRHRRRARAAAHGDARAAPKAIELRATRTSSSALKAMTGGRGPDACIDAVGMEAHGPTLDAYVDKVKAAAFLATDRPSALRQAIHACRKGGIVSIPGVYGGFLDKIPFGAAFQKGLTFKMGQTHMMQVHAAAARAHRARRDRPVLRHHAPPAARRCAARPTRCSATSRTTASRWC